VRKCHRDNWAGYGFRSWACASLALASGAAAAAAARERSLETATLVGALQRQEVEGSEAIRQRGQLEAALAEAQGAAQAQAEALAAAAAAGVVLPDTRGLAGGGGGGGGKRLRGGAVHATDHAKVKVEAGTLRAEVRRLQTQLKYKQTSLNQTLADKKVLLVEVKTVQKTHNTAIYSMVIFYVLLQAHRWWRSLALQQWLTWHEMSLVEAVAAGVTRAATRTMERHEQVRPPFPPLYSRPSSSSSVTILLFLNCTSNRLPHVSCTSLRAGQVLRRAVERPQGWTG
jgi:hypothetical protein